MMLGKQVKCRDCGFLAMTHPDPESLEQLKFLREWGFIGEVECPPQAREKIGDGSHVAPQMLTCIKNVWTRFDMKEKEKTDILNNLNSNRKCPFFFTYNPGYSPVEHKELQRGAKTQSLLIKGMVLAAVIGAIIGALISKLVT